ncbi:MAG TPA: YebC/PmpR family DNA-binding transcriptional regulator [Bacteroidota bacterium]
MSGHSKWATIKHKKAAADSARGRLFTKLIKEISIAARGGGGDPEGNPRLRFAINTAKANNMPAENIKRAIQRGTGELPGTTYEEIIYEGYGPAGIAVLIEAVTDNKNRTVSEIRHVLERNGGKLGELGSVAWTFQKRGVITVPKQAYDEDKILTAILEAGAEDMKAEEEYFEITALPENFENVKKSLERGGIKVDTAELQMVPRSTIRVEGKEADQVLRLMEALEDHDDVQHVYSNFDIDEKVMASFSA